MIYSDARLARAPAGFPTSYSGMGVMDTPTMVWTGLSLASTGLCAYHGYKRNNSVGWAVVWGLLGGMFPVLAPAVAFAQGFGERAR